MIVRRSSRLASHTIGGGLVLLVSLSCGGTKPASPISPSPSTTAPSPAPVPTPAPQATARVLTDRPDDLAGAQIKVLYVLPSDGADLMLDQTGALVTSVESWTGWVAQATGGQRVRLDTFQGALDIAFHRLSRTDAEIASFGITAVNQIQAAIRSAGFADASKIYAVYYGGNNTEHCGQSLRSGGQAIAGAFLDARPSAFAPCSTQIIPDNRTPGLTRAVDRPGYWEFVMAHEVFHMMGAVPACAPHASSGSHVNDSPIDLMGVFTLPGVNATDPAVRWNPSVIDVGRDDYFQHGRSCADVSQSPFLTSGLADSLRLFPTPLSADRTARGEAVRPT